VRQAAHRSQADRTSWCTDRQAPRRRTLPLPGYWPCIRVQHGVGHGVDAGSPSRPRRRACPSMPERYSVTASGRARPAAPDNTPSPIQQSRTCTPPTLPDGRDHPTKSGSPRQICAGPGSHRHLRRRATILKVVARRGHNPCPPTPRRDRCRVAPSVHAAKSNSSCRNASGRSHHQRGRSREYHPPADGWLVGARLARKGWLGRARRSPIRRPSSNRGSTNLHVERSASNHIARHGGNPPAEKRPDANPDCVESISFITRLCYIGAGRISQTT
jgi:hypothetical protein